MEIWNLSTKHWRWTSCEEGQMVSPKSFQEGVVHVLESTRTVYEGENRLVSETMHCG